MPEEFEVDTEELRESVEHEVEHAIDHAVGTGMLRLVALTTAILAAVTAVVSLHAGSTINEALVLKGEATALQARASDQWAYYQAKGIKSAIAAGSANAYIAAGKKPPAELSAQTVRYASEQTAIQAEAKKLEEERDAKSAEADRLLAVHHRYAYAVALLQVAIALGAVAALTRQKAALVLSAAAGVAGIALALVAAFGAGRT